MALDGLEWWHAFLYGGLAILVLMTALWVVSVLVRDVSIVDSVWGPLFGVAALVYFTAGHGWEPRKLLVLALVLIWGVRLGIHIFRRNHGKPEDFRYQEFRRNYGPGYWWISFFQVFLLQGGLAWLISAPILAAMWIGGRADWTIVDGLGFGVWATGMFFETVGDWQLAEFKSDPANKGRLMTTGLWSWTRHPNYFGDACVWWGVWLIGCSAPWGWATVFSPALMTFLLLRVSGVAMLERTMSKRPGFPEYAARTSEFFPLPPRS